MTYDKTKYVNLFYGLDVLEGLRLIPDQTAHCVVCSPSRPAQARGLKQEKECSPIERWAMKFGLYVTGVYEAVIRLRASESLNPKGVRQEDVKINPVHNFLARRLEKEK